MLGNRRLTPPGRWGRFGSLAALSTAPGWVVHTTAPTTASLPGTARAARGTARTGTPVTDRDYIAGNEDFYGENYPVTHPHTLDGVRWGRVAGWFLVGAALGAVYVLFFTPWLAEVLA